MPLTPFRSLIFLTVLPAASLFACAAIGQVEEEFRNLVIDPVLLDEAGEAPRVVDPVVIIAQGVAQFVNDAGRATPDEDVAIVFQEEITAIELRDGLYSADLVEQLLALGRQYQQQDRHIEAVSVLERADHVSRVNNGLYYEGHIPIVRALIESYLAVNDFAQVNDKLQYLGFLGDRLREEKADTDDVPLLIDLAERNLETFGLALIKSENSAGLPYEYDTLRTLSSGTAQAARYYAINSLFRAWRNYSIAIDTLLDTQQYQDPQLLDLEYRLLETTFLLGFTGEFIESPHYYMTSAQLAANMPNQWNYLRRNDEGYANGLDVFQRITTYLDNNPGTRAEDRVQAQIELADWHLLFWRPGAARQAYIDAYTLAQNLGLEEDDIQARFSPDLPLQLPLFTARPNSREKFGIDADEALSYDGFIDMAFSLSRNGSVRNIKILNKAQGTSFEMEDHMRRYLKNSPFRPYIINGEPVVRDEVRMRFYYAYL